MLPQGFKQRMTHLLQEESHDFFQALEEPPVTGIRINTDKISTQDFQNLIGSNLRPVPWCPSGFVLEDKLSGKHPFHAAGLFYFQEPSAMAAAEALQLKTGELVIDLAAAPGGKSTHLVSLTQNQGVVIANEIARSRIKALSENLERWGSHNSVITSQDIGTLNAWHDIADKVLLDAPCSGEGMFRKSAEALEMWSETNILGCAKRQKGLLSDAAKLVKAGGSLVYSTCTFAPEENEEVVAEFLEKHLDFELQEIKLENLSSARSEWLMNIKHDVSKAKRIWPHKTQSEGHFVALFKKVSGDTRQLKPALFHPINKQTEKLWHDFCLGTFSQPILEKPLTLFGDRLFAVDEGIPNLQGVHVIKAGLWLGNVLKNRFEPSHSLALALKSEQLNPAMSIDFRAEDEQLLRYMQGHPLESSGDKGWVIISVAGFPLGWGKRSGNIVNNLYPKGLRI